MHRTIVLICITLILLLFGCEEQNPSSTTILPALAEIKTPEPSSASTKADNSLEEVKPVSSTSLLLQEPITLEFFETPSEALLQWYASRETRPALLLYANDPLLKTTTPAIQKNLLERLSEKDQTVLLYSNPNAAIKPQMTLDVALQAGMFSAVYWVMPARMEVGELSVEILRNQLLEMGALNSNEARTLTLKNGVFSGMVRGVPFYALHPQAEFPISGPVTFHFDLGYLTPLYKKEMKTPIFPLIYQTLRHVRGQQLQVSSASFSYSQVTGKVPLGSRFIGDVFMQLVKDPALLDERLPSAWHKRANAMYVNEMLNFRGARDLYLELAAEFPEDPSLPYALFQVSREIRTARQAALGLLAGAVQRDPVYAYEYLQLAPLAREKGRSDEALRMIKLAHEAIPDNPLITLELARAYLAAGENDKAMPLLQRLITLNWSPTIYSGMPTLLEQLLASVSK
jgi:hypothetical protein